MELYDCLGHAPVTVMLGMCKNAGKTTALNTLIRQAAERGDLSVAFTSIGRDGESRDLVTGTEKPPIWLYKGMLAATAEQLLPLCDISREILSATGLFTSLGEVILFRAKSDGFVQLAGPAMVGQIKALREECVRFGASSVIVDGALSRKSPAAAAADGVCVLSTGASLDRNMEKVVAETAYAAGLLSLPAADVPGKARGRFTLFDSRGESRPAERLDNLKRDPEEKTVLIDGALTESAAAALLKDGTDKKGLTLIARDGSCFLLKRETFEGLSVRGVRLAVLNGTRLAAVTVNPVSAGGWAFDRKVFLEKVRAAVSVPVWDVVEK